MWSFEPRGELSLDRPESYLSVALFSMVGGVIAFLYESLRRVKARAESERNFVQTMLRSIGDGVIATDTLGRVTLMNFTAEAMTGWLQHEALGQPLATVFKIVNEHTRQPVENPVTKALREGVVVGLANHTLLLSRNGVERPVADSAAPIRDANGTVHGVILVFQDNTSARNAENSLRETDRQKDLFLAMLAHELRNPLAPIRTAVDLMQADGVDEETSGWALGLIDQQVTHLTRLVEDLLDVSRIIRGKIALRREPVELKTIVERVLSTQKPTIECDGHELIATIEDKAVWLDADPTRLEQILVNLINNACKYTERGGKIAVSAHIDNGDAYIRVRDTGVGMSPEMLRSLFGLFVQSERSLDRAKGGLGIGLALSQALARLHGGEIIAHSDGPGKGSEFTLRMPVLRDSRGPVDSSQPFNPLPVPPQKILLVDDNHSAAQLLQRVLQRYWNHQVEIAHDGKSALERAEAFDPDIVVLDVGLPVLTGLEVCERLRAMPQFADRPIIALTGYGSDEDREKTAAAGFSAHLVKPVSVHTLQELFKKLNLVGSGS
jgi:PAS domain S-box-containing protein